MADAACICQNPLKASSPLVLDSPHSGKDYPADFRYACPKGWLEETEDSFVDELFAGAPDLGIPLLSAHFPRCYIDPNRAENDIDPLLLDTPWPHNPRPTERSTLGTGLIRRLHKQANPKPIYDRLLSVAEVEGRIHNYYLPYHTALAGLLDASYAVFGTVYHLNCHSMPGLKRTSPRHVDIVLGDLDGTACDPAFTRFAAKTLKNLGYKVAVNDPYKGVELVRRFSDPARGRHSLQIELHRGLYMDAATRKKTDGFTRLQQDMTRFLAQVIDFTNISATERAAETG